jgi:pantothenate kinase
MNEVGKSIEQDCMERCMTEEDFEPAMRRRIVPFHRFHVVQGCLDHRSLQKRKAPATIKSQAFFWLIEARARLLAAR